MEGKIYRAWWQQYLVIFSIIIVILLLIKVSNGVAVKTLLIGILPFVGIIVCGGFLLAKGTYIRTTPDKKMKNVNFGYHHRTFFIRDIKEIYRDPLYAGFGWGFGYQLTIYFTKDDGTADYTHINLNHYKKETITEFLYDILAISPNIKLDSYCQKLIAKKFHNKNFSASP